jgi:hypothetical protein
MKLRDTLFGSLIAAALALAGCGGNGGTSSVTTPAALSNVTGDYTGTLQDTTAGTMVAAVTLSEHGSAVGGALLLGPNGSTSIALAMTLAASNALTGSGTMDTSTVACTFTVSATYAPNANTLTGTYMPVGTCAGFAGGTYSLAQQCMDAVSANRRSTKGLLPHC